DIGQRLDIIKRLNLRDELEEEAQLADFGGFLHDIDAIEVVDNDGFEDEVTPARVLFNLFEDLAEAIDGGSSLPLLGPDRSVEAISLLDHDLHAVKAGFIEGFEDGESSEEEGPRTTGWIENGDLLDTVVESAQQVCPLT